VPHPGREKEARLCPAPPGARHLEKTCSAQPKSFKGMKKYLYLLIEN
jgi:hypothetical protein